jgi:hypothetical protein
MGIKDLFPHRHRSDDPPRGDEPGASTTPSDDGRGTIGLGDRIGGAAPDTNQGKAEPMPPTPGHGDPAGTGPHTTPPAVPELGEMGAGMAMAQVASPTVLSTPHAGGGGTPDDGGLHGGRPGTGPAEDRPAVGPSVSTATDSGPGTPQPQATGTSSRAPDQQGVTPDGESVDSDLEVGAARMAPGGGPDATAPPVAYPGDSQGVNVPHELPMEGTSEEQSVVHGVKDPARP